jgi:hypothetical protein
MLVRRGGPDKMVSLAGLAPLGVAMTSHFVWVSVRRLLNSASVVLAVAVLGSPMRASADGSQAVFAPGAYAAPQETRLDPQPASPDEVPAHIAIVDGAATLEREGRIESTIENVALVAGDRLQTERGRVEVLFADGSTLDVDEHSSVDFLSDSLMRLLAGRARLSIARLGGALAYRIDTAPASVVIRSPGDYRLALSDRGPAELELAVLRGSAELQNAYGRTIVRAGAQARATDRGEPSVAFAFNSAAWDPFDRWVEDQRSARYSVSSSQYLPADLRYYGGTLDQNGAWGYEPAYGYVWYPTVAPIWRPYSAGRWSYMARFGWFWVGYDRWAWPTHHYGRWGVNASRWFWIPDGRWGPAWVTWATGPGYVGWCPLGFDGRAAVSLTAVSHVGGWTAVPARVFTPNVVVSRYAVDGQSPAVRSSLAVHPTAPPVNGFSGGAAPLRSPTAAFGDRARAGTAVPRQPGTVAYPLRAADGGTNPGVIPGSAVRTNPYRTTISRAEREQLQQRSRAPLTSPPQDRQNVRQAVPRYGSGATSGPPRGALYRAAEEAPQRAPGVWRVNPSNGSREIPSAMSSGSREFSRVQARGLGPSARPAPGGNPAASSPSRPSGGSSQGSAVPRGGGIRN